MKNTAVVLMAKAPVPGLVKTRLGGYLSESQCAELYKRFLLDIVDCVAASGLKLYVAYTPADCLGLMQKTLPKGTSLFPQEGDDLGQRMANAINKLFSQQVQRCIVIGGDVPLLQPSHLLQAAIVLGELKSNRVCLGPAKDGGYYLIGLSASELTQGLFSGIHWSSPSVLAETVDRARVLGLSVELLPELPDVDRMEDLLELQRLLKYEQHTLAKVPLRTWAYLKEAIAHKKNL